jgi:TatD DNase family protein
MGPDGYAESPSSRTVDTHCHLYLLSEDPTRAVESARAAGVENLVCAGDDPDTSHRAIDLADAIPGVLATAGMHPHTASEFDRTAGAKIEAMLSHPKVVAVGECGLDYYRMRSAKADQQRAFEFHISLSRQTGFPIVVHVRDAWPDALRLLEEGSAERVVLHCFSGDVDIAMEAAARGYFLSFAANLTYPRNGHLREAAAAAPVDRLLAETDSPFLPPQSLRGRENSPANVIAVIQELAAVRSMPFERVCEAVTANAEAAFPRLH